MKKDNSFEEIKKRLAHLRTEEGTADFCVMVRPGLSVERAQECVTLYRKIFPYDWDLLNASLPTHTAAPNVEPKPLTAEMLIDYMKKVSPGYPYKK